MLASARQPTHPTSLGLTKALPTPEEVARRICSAVQHQPARAPHKLHKIPCGGGGKRLVEPLATSTAFLTGRGGCTRHPVRTGACCLLPKGGAQRRCEAVTSQQRHCLGQGGSSPH